MKPLWCCSSYMFLLFGVRLDIFISTGLFEQTKSNSIKVKYTVDSDLTFFFYIWQLDLLEKKNRHWVKYWIGWDLFFIYSSLSVFGKTCDYEGNVLLLYFCGFPCEVALKKNFKTESKRSTPLKQQDNRSAHILRNCFLLSTIFLFLSFLTFALSVKEG